MTCRKTIFTSIVVAIVACTSPIELQSPPSVGDVSLARATSLAPTVTAAVPSAAPQGTTLDVEIDGTGFDSGSHASFERGGVADPKVHVNSTRYVKSTQLVANVTIEVDATVSPYDVAVFTVGGKKGIGTDAFTVQLANELPTFTVVDAQSVNFASDGRGDYVSGQCGIDGSIFYANYDPATGAGGDATFNNAHPGSATCAPRSVTATLNGIRRNVWFFNVRAVVGLAVGESKTQDFTIDVDGDKSCTRVAWKTVADGGAGGRMVVTRTAFDTWTATTTGSARCLYFQGQTRVWGRSFTDVQVGLVVKQQP